MTGKHSCSRIIGVAVSATLVCLPTSVAAGAATKDTTPMFATLPNERTPVGRVARVPIAVKVPGRYEVLSRKITARQGKRTVKGKWSVKVGPGRWKIARQVTYRTKAGRQLPDQFVTRTITAVPGQCTITNVGYTDVYSKPYLLGVSCAVDGSTLTGTYYPISDGGGALLRTATDGADLVATLTDPGNFETYSPVKSIPSPTFTVTGLIPAPPAAPAGPEQTARTTSIVRVREYNPGCVTAAEYRQLRIGMTTGTWHRIVGGRGSFESRVAGGFEVRSYWGCWWSGPDEVWIEYQSGRVLGWQRY